MKTLRSVDFASYDGIYDMTRSTKLYLSNWFACEKTDTKSFLETIETKSMFLIL